MQIAKMAMATGRQNGILPKDGAEANGIAEASTSERNPNADTVYISAEAKSLLSEIYDDKRAELLEMKERLANLNEQEGSLFDVEIKCLKIAMRIMKGDYVPKKDENFLAENEPEMYLRAVLLRKQNEDPEDHDSLLEDKEESSEESSSASDAAVSAASTLTEASTANTAATVSNDSVAVTE